MSAIKGDAKKKQGEENKVGTRGDKTDLGCSGIVARLG